MLPMRQSPCNRWQASAAAALFAGGLIFGAALLAASVLPLSTAYSVCEYSGFEAALDDGYRQARTFYLDICPRDCSGSACRGDPGIPLVTILVGTQVLNAVLLIPLLCVMIAIGRDENLMGEQGFAQREA